MKERTYQPVAWVATALGILAAIAFEGIILYAIGQWIINVLL